MCSKYKLCNNVCHTPASTDQKSKLHEIIQIFDRNKRNRKIMNLQLSEFI